MRSQSCDLQMKATQPETFSLAPPSTSSIFDLYTFPSSGLRMVPPDQESPSVFMPRMTSMPVIGLPLRSSLHLSQLGSGRLGSSSSMVRPLYVPPAALEISTIDFALPVSSSIVFHWPAGPLAWALAPGASRAAVANRTAERMYMRIGGAPG